MVKLVREDPRRDALMEAIRNARRERMTQVELADKLGVKQTYISKWETTWPPRPGQVAEIEEALDLPAGTLMREAGYVEGMSVEDAIKADLKLTPAQQQNVLAAYRVALRESAKSRRATKAK